MTENKFFGQTLSKWMLLIFTILAIVAFVSCQDEQDGAGALSADASAIAEACRLTP